MLNKMRLRNSRYLALNWEEVSSVKYVCVCVCVLGGGGGGLIYFYFPAECNSKNSGLPYYWFTLHNIPLVSFLCVYYVLEVQFDKSTLCQHYC